jgi:hypothetical protein
MTTTLDAITIRMRPAADAEIVRLADLDSARAPEGAVLSAEVEGRVVAAVFLADGSAIADPFVRTLELVELLRAHARGLEPVQRRRPAFASRLRHALAA